ncbi:hypothetical protein EYF80_013741 [Liparis tanakae]|uniref:Uncharacterized protein n=1 Tax=Liparis tanakae TaxID=230148 RepID=A0A4Z2IDB3_9TELE|nr:hypothetical protein EYF80_013741 [Liparis tanakae]
MELSSGLTTKKKWGLALCVLRLRHRAFRNRILLSREVQIRGYVGAEHLETAGCVLKIEVRSQSSSQTHTLEDGRE